MKEKLKKILKNKKLKRRELKMELDKGDPRIYVNLGTHDPDIRTGERERKKRN